MNQTYVSFIHIFLWSWWIMSKRKRNTITGHFHNGPTSKALVEKLIIYICLQMLKIGWQVSHDSKTLGTLNWSIVFV